MGGGEEGNTLGEGPSYGTTHEETRKDRPQLVKVIWVMCLVYQ